MAETQQYWEGSDIHDLTYDEMVETIENYIDFCKYVRDELPEFETDGYVRIGFHQKPNSNRCELIAFDPHLDSVYTTIDVVNKIVKKYPDLFEGRGRAPSPGKWTKPAGE